MEKLYWDNKKHLGIKIYQFHRKEYIDCLLDDDAWIDNSIGSGKHYFYVSFPMKECGLLKENIKSIESRIDEKGLDKKGFNTDWHFQQIFEKLDAWNYLLDRNEYPSFS